MIHIENVFNAMKQTRYTLQKGQAIVALLLCSLFLIVSPSFSQKTTKNSGTLNITTAQSFTNFENYKTTTAGTVNNSSTTTVSGNYDNGIGTTNNSTATSIIRIGGTLTLGTGAFTTTVGEVEYAGAAAQTVISGVASSTYGKLTLSGGGTKTLGGSVVVNGLVTIAASTEFAVGASNTLTLNAATPFSNSGILTASTAGATVVYNNSSNQYVTGAAYYNLTITNGGTKTVSDGAATVSIAAGGMLTNGTGTFDLASYALTTTATSSISNGGTIQTAGNVTFGATHTIAGTFIYQATTGTQSISTANYTTLTLSGGSGATGQKNFPTGTVSVSGTYSVSGADRSYGTGTFVYNGTAAQNIIAGASNQYNNLSLSGTADTSIHKTVTTGNLTVNGDLTIGTNTNLDMAAYTGTFGGSASNSGKIMWQVGNAYVGGTGMTEFYGTTGGNVAAGTSYGNMLFSGTGLMTFATAGTTIVSGNITINAGAPVTVNNGVTVQVNGDVDNNGALTINGILNVGN
jgi:hypothetical protein